MTTVMNRRGFLCAAAAGAGAAVTSSALAQTPAQRYQESISPWPLALNASTIRPTPPLDKIRVAAETGWDAIELWINDLEQIEDEGGNLKDVAKQIQDLGLFVPNIIGLWDCLPPTPAAFNESLVKTRERMCRAADIGSHFVAAIPSPDRPDFDLKWGAECYRRLLDIGRNDYGITVAFEFVGFMKGVHRLGQAAAIALDADHPDACLICDTFHLYRGGSGFHGIRHVAPTLIANFHWNDMPADVPQFEGKDEHRLYPGEGILPLNQALQDLKAIGYARTLSLELFRREHWEQDPKAVAETGLRKMRDNIAAAGV
ncbi:MAG: sugar phosphate isomerase/epimerase [Candidatus Hydrogenedentes bacterium]|nr:sugar phosphate isomerase/epimerase [Candidatus Hydrogenedentota bacterium]